MFKALLAEKNEDGEISVAIQELNDEDLPDSNSPFTYVLP